MLTGRARVRGRRRHRHARGGDQQRAGLRRAAGDGACSGAQALRRVPPARIAKRRLRDIARRTAGTRGARSRRPRRRPTASVTSPAPRGQRAGMTALAVATVIAALALAVPAVRHLREESPRIRPRPVHDSAARELAVWRPRAGGSGSATQLAVSPDGRYVVFVAVAGRGAQLWVRPIGAVAEQPLPGTEDASFPFWSPDSRYIGFFAGGKLKKIPVAGGRLSVVRRAPGRGGAWSRDNVILFSTGTARRSSASPRWGRGGAVSVLDAAYGETAHRWPHFLPGRPPLFLHRDRRDAAVLRPSRRSSTLARSTRQTPPRCSRPSPRCHTRRAIWSSPATGL